MPLQLHPAWRRRLLMRASPHMSSQSLRHSPQGTSTSWAFQPDPCTSKPQGMEGHQAVPHQEWFCTHLMHIDPQNCGAQADILSALPSCSHCFVAIHPSALLLRHRLGQVLAIGTFANASIVASGIGDVYVIGVESAVSVNLAGTASVTIAAEAGGDHTHSLGASVLNHTLLT